jgi:hypothetical protein
MIGMKKEPTQKEEPTQYVSPPHEALQDFFSFLSAFIMSLFLLQCRQSLAVGPAIIHD